MTSLLIEPALKRCFKCGQSKPISGFYRHPQMGDGHLGKCKECTKADAAYRERWLRATDPEWVARERARCAAKQRGYQPDPEKERAREAARGAIAKGLIAKPDHCQRCGNRLPAPRIHAHHADYSRPLDVVFVCAGCHAVLDGRARPDSPAAQEMAA